MSAREKRRAIKPVYSGSLPASDTMKHVLYSWRGAWRVQIDSQPGKQRWCIAHQCIQADGHPDGLPAQAQVKAGCSNPTPPVHLYIIGQERHSVDPSEGLALCNLGAHAQY